MNCRVFWAFKSSNEKRASLSLSVKYAILHKIGIANWFPSSHASSVSAALGTFLYQSCIDETVDVGLFIYNQLLRHVGNFGVKISILCLDFSRACEFN